MTTSNSKLHTLELTDREVKTIGEKRWLYKHRTSVMASLVIPVVIYFLLQVVSYEAKLSIPTWILYVITAAFLIAIGRYIFGSESAGKAYLQYILEKEQKGEKV
jgi:hypothetical protein